MFHLWLTAQFKDNALAILRNCAATLFVSVLLTSCAYRAGSGDRQIPGGYRAISVPTFKNETQEAGIEVYFTNSLIREIELSRIGSVTPKDLSQVTLEGTIDSVQYTGGSPLAGAGEGSNGLPSGTVLNLQYTVNVSTTLRLRRNSDGKVLWESSFTKGQTYQTPRIGIIGLTGANAVYNHSARYQNIETIAADMMLEAHDRLTENF